VNLRDAKLPDFVRLEDGGTCPRGILGSPFNMTSKGGGVQDIFEIRAYRHHGLLATVVGKVFKGPLLELQLPVKLGLGTSEILVEIDAELLQEVSGKNSK
jgi:hypothetical protein